MNLTTFDKLYLGVTIPVVGCGAIYLLPGVLQWPHLGLVVTLQIAVLAAATLIHATRVLSWPSALLLGGLAFAVAWLAESRPLRSAIFGSDYDYAAFLGPQLPGGVPLTVPLMWFGMCYLAWLYSSPLGGRAILRAILCGYLLCAFDLLLDPIATASGAFIWQTPGLYYTTPLQNFAGWFAVGAIVSAGLTAGQRLAWLPQPPPGTQGHQWIAGMLGIAAFALPAGLAVLVGRPAAALSFIIAFAPVAVVWVLRGRKLTLVK